jgi:dipeptidase
MNTRGERRWWALDMAAALLYSDTDCMALDEFDENEAEKRRESIREIADSLKQRADKIQRRLNQR